MKAILLFFLVVTICASSCSRANLDQRADVDLSSSPEAGFSDDKYKLSALAFQRELLTGGLLDPVPILYSELEAKRVYNLVVVKAPVNSGLVSPHLTILREIELAYREKCSDSIKMLKSPVSGLDIFTYVCPPPYFSRWIEWRYDDESRLVWFKNGIVDELNLSAYENHPKLRTFFIPFRDRLLDEHEILANHLVVMDYLGLDRWFGDEAADMDFHYDIFEQREAIDSRNLPYATCSRGIVSPLASGAMYSIKYSLLNGELLEIVVFYGDAN